MFSKNEVREALEFLKVAEKDFEAAELLLNNKHYPQGLFMLQQSIEKASKAILRALGIADIKTLKEKVSHKILVKGLKLITSRLGDMFKKRYKEYKEMYTVLKNFRSYVEVLCREVSDDFKEVLNELEKALKIVDESKNIIMRKANRVYSEISKQAKEIGRIALHKADQETVKQLDEFFESLAIYVQKPWLLLEEPKIIEMSNALKNVWRKLNECLVQIRKEIKGEGQQMQFGKIDKELMKGIDKDIRAMYLLTTFMFLSLHHAVFEYNISKLRYPDKEWSPLSISDDTLIVIEAKKFMEFVKGSELLRTIEEFIKGTFSSDRSRKVYDSLVKYLEALLGTKLLEADSTI